MNDITLILNEFENNPSNKEVQRNFCSGLTYNLMKGFFKKNPNLFKRYMECHQYNNPIWIYDFLMELLKDRKYAPVLKIVPAHYVPEEHIFMLSKIDIKKYMIKKSGFPVDITFSRNNNTRYFKVSRMFLYPGNLLVSGEDTIKVIRAVDIKKSTDENKQFEERWHDYKYLDSYKESKSTKAYIIKHYRFEFSLNNELIDTAIIERNDEEGYIKYRIIE